MTDDPAKPSLVGEVQYTTQAAPVRTSQAVEAPVRTMLVVPAEEMTPSRVSAVAGRIGVSAQRVQALVDEGRPVPVQAGLRGRSVVRELHDEPLDVIAAGPPGAALPALGVGAALIGSGLIGIGAALALFTTLGAIAAIAVGAVVLASAFVPLILWLGQFAQYRRTAASWRSLRDDARSATQHALVGEARGRLAAIRVHLANADLPTLAESDIRSGLKEIEEDLLTLAHSWDQLPTGQAGAEARARLEAQVGRVGGGLADLREALTQASMQSHDEAGSTLKATLAAAQLAVDGLAR